MSDELPELLADTLRRHCNVNAFGKHWLEDLRRELDWPGDPQRAPLFRKQLAEAILHGTVSPEQYERLTGQDFDGPVELAIWLSELWKYLYGDEPVRIE